MSLFAPTLAGYGTARSLATRLREDAGTTILQRTLDEEGAADKKLTQIAEGQVNSATAAAGVR